MSAERFQPKDTPLTTFAEEVTTFYLLVLTSALTALISQMANQELGLITLGAGGATTIASFAAGRIINRPQKPLAAENPSSVKTTRLTTIKVVS